MASLSAVLVIVCIFTISIGPSLGFSVSHHKSRDNQPDLIAGNSVAYVKASIPVKIFQCIQRLNILRCMRIFILQRMERTSMATNTGNLTADFLDRILSTEDTDDRNLWESELAELTDVQLNGRLQTAFQTFFSKREIKLYFVPGMVVKVVPSTESYLNFTIKKSKQPTNLILYLN